MTNLKTPARRTWRDRLTEYFLKAEEKASIDEQDNYRFCRRLVSLALDGWTDPYVAAFYYQYGKHPNKLIPEFLWRAEKNRRLKIPDYDPLSDPLCEIRSFPSRPGPVYRMPETSWPTQQDSLRSSPEEERDSEPPISGTGAEHPARPNAFPDIRRLYARKHRREKKSLNMCVQCRNPVCTESIGLCSFHLQRARETSLACYTRKRLAMGKTVTHGKGWHARHARKAVESTINGGFYGT
jgi:hypothetical protein